MANHPFLPWCTFAHPKLTSIGMNKKKPHGLPLPMARLTKEEFKSEREGYHAFPDLLTFYDTPRI